MKSLTILSLSITIISCSHAKNTSQQARENEISKVLTSRTLAISDDINQSRKLYITAYNSIESKSEINNELFIYTVRKVDSLIGNYEIDQNSFENDIKVNKNITLEAVDGLCIMNKFLQKYSKFININKIPPNLQKDLNRTLSFQPAYLEKLSTSKDYLGQLKCLELKEQNEIPKKTSIFSNFPLAIFFILIIYVSFIVLNKKDNKIELSINDSNIYFTFSEKNIIIHGYEVRSFLEREKNSLEYKKILKKNIEENISLISIENYNSHNIEKNKPYYISISREGLANEPGVVMQSINFCIKDVNLIYSEKNEEIFIKNCIN